MKKHSLLTPLVVFATILVGGCNTTAPTPTTTANPQTTVGNITVAFQNPDKFTDARSSFGGSYDQSYLDQLSNELQQNAARFVPADQKLFVNITDIDLAGEFRPDRVQMTDVRLIKDIYRPRMTLTFKLTGADGKVIKEGARTLSDSYFMSNVNTINRNEPLFYDKEMVNNWVRDEFKH